MLRTLMSCGLAAAALSGCVSITEGTSQELVVSTNPPEADCTLVRQDIAIAKISSTPGAATVQKTKDDITVTCVKEGFEKATYLNHSGAAGATFANIILGGGIGWAIDSASGADNKYDTPVNITLVPTSSATVVPDAPAAAAPAAPVPADSVAQ
jgi:hypothetical protein